MLFILPLFVLIVLKDSTKLLYVDDNGEIDDELNYVGASDDIERINANKDEVDMLNDIFFLLKEMLNEDKTKSSLTTLKYLYHFLQTLPGCDEIKYILGYFAKNSGYVKPNQFDFDHEEQFIFESIMFSAITLYESREASRVKLAESHRRWEAYLDRKNEEKLSRTQELNTAKVQALRELGYTEITEANASEVFDKIAEKYEKEIEKN